MATLKEQVLLTIGNSTEYGEPDADGVCPVTKPAKGLMKSIETIQAKDITDSLKLSQIRGVFRDRFGSHLTWQELEKLMAAGKWDVIIGHMRQADHAKGQMSQRVKGAEASLNKAGAVFSAAFSKPETKSEPKAESQAEGAGVHVEGL